MTSEHGQVDLVFAATAAGQVAINRRIGNIRQLAFVDGERRVAPLHTAPWVGEAAGELPAGLDPVERGLSGDFFCAPFGANNLEPGPIHGWTANSAWQVLEHGEGTLGLRLERPVMGATVFKSLSLGRNAPLLSQRHRIVGGEGRLPVAHHPMIHMAAGGRFTTSAKRLALTPEMPLEPGRNRLACPAGSTDPAAFPAAGGGTVDLGQLPVGRGTEDFVTLIEAEGSRLGWSAVLRAAEDDIVIVLKDPRVLPVTMLWHSNGGRDYSPWNGRHSGVLGIEDGVAPGAAGHRGVLGANPISDAGVPVALDLAPGREHVIEHAILAFARPAGWGAVADVEISGDRLTVTADTGGNRSFDLDPEIGLPGR
ncbi:hypothetical protein [Tropicimonas sp.]|uniref:hypothetical protein n=1 Tax=Tropicimonas sp. TaxID=2067044 RepID=UPI003A8C06E3